MDPSEESLLKVLSFCELDFTRLPSNKTSGSFTVLRFQRHSVILAKAASCLELTKQYKNVPTQCAFDHCRFRSNCYKNPHSLNPKSRRAVGHCTFCLAVPGFQHSAASMTKKDGLDENPWLLHADLAALSKALTGRRLSGSSWLNPRPHLLQIIGSLPGHSPRNPSLQAWFLLLAQGGRAQSTALTHPWPEDGLHILSSCFVLFHTFWFRSVFLSVFIRIEWTWLNYRKFSLNWFENRGSQFLTVAES